MKIVLMIGESATPALIPARLRSVPAAAGTLALTAAVAAATALAQHSAADAVLRALLVLVVVPCAVIDLHRRIIPNRITGPAALLAIGLGAALDPSGEPTRLLWAAIAGGFLLLAALVAPAGMGMGDVKLLAVMGLLLGPAVVVALLVALLGNIAAAAVLAARHGVTRARKTQLPFGPYLAVGAIVSALAGNPILHAYLHLHH